MLDAAGLERLIRDVRDFPREGVVFKDITTMLTHPGALNDSVALMEQRIEDLEYDAIAAIESRGFVFGAVLASRRGLPLVLVRKPGKLPAEVISQDYELEYGSGTIEMHRNSLPEGSRVLIVDDLVATGGSVSATAKLIRRDGCVPVAALFLVNLEFLGGRERIEKAGIRAEYLIEVR